MTYPKNGITGNALSVVSLVEDILLACQNNDFRGLAEALKGIKDTKEELAPYYLQAFKRAPKISVNDVQAILIHINETIEATREKGCGSVLHNFAFTVKFLCFFYF